MRKHILFRALCPSDWTNTAALLCWLTSVPHTRTTSSAGSCFALPRVLSSTTCVLTSCPMLGHSSDILPHFLDKCQTQGPQSFPKITAMPAAFQEPVLLELSAGAGGKREGEKLAQQSRHAGALLNGDSPHCPAPSSFQRVATLRVPMCFSTVPSGLFPLLNLTLHLPGSQEMLRTRGKGDPWVTFCPHVPHLFQTALPCPTATVCPTDGHSTVTGMGGTL